MIFFPLSERDEGTVDALLSHMDGERGELELDRFPDQERYLRVHSDVEGKSVVIVHTLIHPDEHFLTLYFLSRTAKDLGAERVDLLAPYLAYMRQDRRFEPGEALSSAYFAELLSGMLDGLVTVEPHLHRWNALSDIYSIPYEIVHASSSIADQLIRELDAPFLIGPDEESEQWVRELAERAGAPYMIREKERHGGREVEVSASGNEVPEGSTPVLVDDIASTGRTMIETVERSKKEGTRDPVCVVVHPLFVDDAYQELQSRNARVVSCNTVPHPSNGIDLTQRLAEGIKRLHRSG
jgi:ribose-phosphate pyrophosphokinase